jgi:hypothetical protein
LSLDDPDAIPAMLESKLAQRGDESFHQLEAAGELRRRGAGLPTLTLASDAKRVNATEPAVAE